jgi:glyoxylase-like metal-dependent hydrolase (beta-lactamase superfamily II)
MHLIRQPRMLALPAAALAALSVASCGGSDADLSLAAPAPYVATFQEPAATLSEYDRHRAMATANAGSDPFFAGELRRQWCYSAENTGFPPELSNTAVVPATKLFDDLYFTGLRWVGQYLLKTSAGIFLIDTLNNATEVQAITLPALQAMGTTPQQVIGALPTHGHGDHHGGAQYLWETYGIKTSMGSADIPLVRVATRGPIPASVPLIPVDSTVSTPQAFTVGDKTLVLLSTPGHTPGTVSGIVPVTQGGKGYKLAFWGGTGMPTTLGPAKQYLDGAERLWQLAKAQRIDGTLHTHPFVDGSLHKVDAIRANPSAPNPFLIGHADAMRSLSMLRECAAAKVGQLDASARSPLWRFTRTEITGVKTAPAGTGNDLVAVAARVTQPFAVVSGGSVRFEVAGTGHGCTATTDAAGIASCRFETAAGAGRRLGASFAGRGDAGAVDLASEAEVGF